MLPAFLFSLLAVLPAPLKPLVLASDHMSSLRPTPSPFVVQYLRAMPPFAAIKPIAGAFTGGKKLLDQEVPLLALRSVGDVAIVAVMKRRARSNTPKM